MADTTPATRVVPEVEEEREEIIVEEDWSSLMTLNSSGSFARHDISKVVLPNPIQRSAPKVGVAESQAGEDTATMLTLSIASTSALSPLDMMDLSWGTHDATGHKIWMGAHLFVQALPSFRHGNYLSSQSRCLELGSGTGLAGLALAKYFGEPLVSQLMLTDNSESALALCRYNCKLNDFDLEEQVTVRSLEWGKENATELFQDSRVFFDAVIATDILYDIDSWEPFLATARIALGGRLDGKGGYLIVSHVPRAALPDDTAEDINTSEPNKEQKYQSRLEKYLISKSQAQGFDLRRTLHPMELPMFNGQSDMEDAGARILIFKLLS